LLGIKCETKTNFVHTCMHMHWRCSTVCRWPLARLCERKH